MAFLLSFVVDCWLHFGLLCYSTIINSSDFQLRSVSRKTSRALICFVVAFRLFPTSFYSQLRSVSKKTSRAGSRVKRVVDPAAQAKVNDLNR